MAADCSLSVGDRAWLDRAVGAWAYSNRHLTGAALVAPVRILIFDAECTLSSDTLLSGAAPSWSASRHGETVPLPGGDSVPAKVMSFASQGSKGSFFVMSTPSVWQAGGVDGGPLGLETLMVAVMLHEGSHAAQFSTYGARMTAITAQWHLPDTFGDDSIQQRFAANPDFAASVARETRLFLDAADAPDRGRAIRLAREARRMMRARQARWYPASEGYLPEAEDIWLTMEGSGQWAGYQWLVSSHGGRLPPALATSSFGRRGKSWSQLQGFAMAKALTRLGGLKWQRHAFGDGRKTLVTMIDEVVGPT